MTISMLNPLRRPPLRNIILVATLGLAGCSSVPTPAPDRKPAASTATQTAIRAVLEAQQQSWNAGDIDNFMLGYAQGDTTRFASGDRVLLGWQQVLERYKTAYSSRAAMGTLDFSEIDIVAMGREHALAFGRWRLKRDLGDLNGLFTLVFQKTRQGWRIVHDHTSKADTPGS